mmetsp:Transcript_65580/g.166229  ORF Transcript_65580/g.166229 Transcript_65580/m.166229 type:complete len:939 (+) Transcript_65580:107-2923(+)
MSPRCGLISVALGIVLSAAVCDASASAIYQRLALAPHDRSVFLDGRNIPRHGGPSRRSRGLAAHAKLTLNSSLRSTSVAVGHAYEPASVTDLAIMDDEGIVDGAEEDAASAIADADSLNRELGAAPQVVHFVAHAVAPVAAVRAAPPPGIAPELGEGRGKGNAQPQEVKETQKMLARGAAPFATASIAASPSPASVSPQAPAASPVPRAAAIAKTPVPKLQAPEEEEQQQQKNEEREKDKELDVAAAKEEAKAEVDEEIRAAEKDGADSDNEDNRDADLASESKPEPPLSEEHHLERLQRQLARETKSEALAEMIGGLKMDMYLLKDKINQLHREISDGVALAGPDPSETLVYPVSVCMQCILLLTAVYFVIYTMLAVCKAFTEVFGMGENTTLELALHGACESIFHAPMICVLFLGTQLRATQISEETHGPPIGAEYAMELCTWSLLVRTFLVLALPAFMGEAVAVSEDGLKFPSHDNRAVASLLTLLRYGAMLCLYTGLVVLCIEAVIMDTRSLNVQPIDLWDDPTTVATEYAPPLSVAMQCTLFLTHLFFLIYIMHAIVQFLTQLLGDEAFPGNIHDEPPVLAREWAMKWEHCLRVCANTVGLAPMVCIVFMAARMRALEIDPREGKPQWWAEALFKVCTTAVAAQVAFVLVPQLAGIAPDERPFSRSTHAVAGGDSTREDGAFSEISCAEASLPERVILVLRGIAALAAHCSVAGIAVSTLLIGSSHGGEVHREGGGSEGGASDDSHMPPVSPTLMCVIMMAVIYFGVYLCLFVAQAAAMMIFSFSSTITHSRVEALLRTVEVFKMGECVVRLSPMVALLFLGARMRALHLSDYQGSPQCWAQDAMYAATFALIAQLLVILIAGALSRKVYVGADGSPVTKRMKYVPGRVFLEVIKTVSFLTLYGGIIIVGASVLSIRPETAGCPWRGFRPLVH